MRVDFDFVVKNIKNIYSLIVKVEEKEFEFKFLQYFNNKFIVATESFFSDSDYYLFPNGKLIRKHDNGKKEQLSYEIVDATV